jgi:hypothetical protein
MTYQFIDEKGEHMHVLDNAPLYGTSTLIGEVMPPYLAKWGGQCAVDYLKSKSIMDVDRFGARIPDLEDFEKAITAYTKVGKKAMQKGTDLHALLEEYVQGCIQRGGSPDAAGGGDNEKVRLFSDWSRKHIEKFLFAEAHTYSKELWVGGIVDCMAILKTGEVAIIDFKSGKVPYFSSFVQIGGYACQIEEMGWGRADGSDWRKLSFLGQIGGIDAKIGALIIVPFGNDYIKPEIIRNVEGFKDSFRHMVEVFKLLKAFKDR